MWSDRETEQDCLGFSSYVSVLADICTHQGIAPLALGIFGFWGSGKTSLMRMLMQHIGESRTDGKTKTLWFNAWRYEGRDEAQSALIHSILAKIAEGRTLRQEAMDAIKRIKDGASILKLAKFITKAAITMTPDIAGFIDCFRDESEKVADTMERFEKDFQGLLNSLDIEHVIVFIDDLDRCSSEKVMETFETIKLFLNVPTCTFVIGADPKKIERAVGDVYGVAGDSQSQFARDYLEKIIQIPFFIPEQQASDISCYVGMLVMREHLTDEGWEALLADRKTIHGKGTEIGRAFKDWVLANEERCASGVESTISELNNILPYVNILAHGLRGNPRQLKRFLNILSLRRRLAEANELDVKADLLIKITVLEYAWRDFFSAVVDTIDPQTGRSELIGETLNTADSGKADEVDSPLIATALKSTILVEFLKADPQLGPDVDLTPYLFLAQTAFGSTRFAALAPFEETARSLAGQILSQDRVKSRAAARKAASSDPSIASMVVKTLLPDLLVGSDPVTLTNTVVAVDEICRTHPSQYESTLSALDRLNTPDSPAVSVAVSTLLSNAAAKGCSVSEALKKRFPGIAALEKLIAKPTKQSTPGKGD